MRSSPALSSNLAKGATVEHMRPSSAPAGGVAWLLVNLFLIVGWYVTVAPFFQLQLGLFVVGRVAAVGLLVYPVLLLGAVVAYEQAAAGFVPIKRSYILAYSAVMGWMLLNGFFHGNPLRVIYFDFITVTTFGCAFILGRHDQLWIDIKPLVTGLTAISIVFAFRFTDSEVLHDRSILNLQAGSHFESVLTLAPLLAMVSVSGRLRRKGYLVLLVLSAGCLLIYLYFGRRGISIRAGLELFLAAVVLPLILRRTMTAIVSISLTAIFVFGLFTYFPFEVIMQRFQGDYGVVDTVVYGNDRWVEVGLMIGEMSPLEHAFGRGLGGAFLSDADAGFATDELEENQYGRLYPHVGAATPLLKGGLVFTVIYFAPFFLLFGSLTRWRNLDPITLGAALGGLVMIAFQAIEGTSTYSTPWVGFGVGLIASRSQSRHNIGRTVAPVNRIRP